VTMTKRAERRGRRRWNRAIRQLAISERRRAAFYEGDCPACEGDGFSHVYPGGPTEACFECGGSGISDTLGPFLCTAQRVRETFDTREMVAHYARGVFSAGDRALRDGRHVTRGAFGHGNPIDLLLF